MEARCSSSSTCPNRLSRSEFRETSQRRSHFVERACARSLARGHDLFDWARAKGGSSEETSLRSFRMRWSAELWWAAPSSRATGSAPPGRVDDHPFMEGRELANTHVPRGGGFQA